MILLLLAVAANAQEKPDIQKPKPHRDTVFWLGTAALAASKTFDATETRSLLNRGGWENNRLFGRHPSPAKLTGVNAGIFAAQSTAFYFTERSRQSESGEGRATADHAGFQGKCHECSRSVPSRRRSLAPNWRQGTAGAAFRRQDSAHRQRRYGREHLPVLHLGSTLPFSNQCGFVFEKKPAAIPT